MEVGESGQTTRTGRNAEQTALRLEQERAYATIPHQHSVERTAKGWKQKQVQRPVMMVLVLVRWIYKRNLFCSLFLAQLL